jgi:quercetin dioxygenase-like cupin family protein
MADASATIPFIGTVRLDAARSHGAMEVIEYAGPATPPPHVHRDHEECFYVLEGTFRFDVGGDTIEAPRGTTVFVRRGTPHGFTVEPGSKALLVIVPAGLEGFFRELGEGLAAGMNGDEIRARLAGKYDSHPT